MEGHCPREVVVGNLYWLIAGFITAAIARSSFQFEMAMIENLASIWVLPLSLGLSRYSRFQNWLCWGACQYLLGLGFWPAVFGAASLTWFVKEGFHLETTPPPCPLAMPLLLVRFLLYLPLQNYELKDPCIGILSSHTSLTHILHCH